MIIFDKLEKVFKFIIKTDMDNMGNTIYIANDNKEYGITKNTNYTRIDESLAVKWLNQAYDYFENK